MNETYQLISSILLQRGAEIEAAEAHGIAAGMLCVDTKTGVNQWLQELLENGGVLNPEDDTVLVEFFEQTRKLLDGYDEQFAFDLLLPEENEELSVQAEGLRLWCQGYLYGFGKLNQDGQISEECDEILHDMVEFTKLESQAENDENEMALMEIHEYIRSAVLLVRDDMFEHKNRPQN